MADLPEDTIAEYQEAFALFDKDGNGHIEAKELAAVLTALGQSPSEEDIAKMIAADGPVIADIAVDKTENCFPMIPSGAAHCDMLLGPEDEASRPISEDGMVLV